MSALENVQKICEVVSEVDAAFCEKVHSIQKSIETLQPHVSKYDFEGVEFNGLRSLLDIWNGFFQKARTELEKSRKPKTLKRLNDVADLLLVQTELTEDAVLEKNALTEHEYHSKVTSITEDKYLSLVKIGFFYLPEPVSE